MLSRSRLLRQLPQRHLTDEGQGIGIKAQTTHAGHYPPDRIRVSRPGPDAVARSRTAAEPPRIRAPIGLLRSIRHPREDHLPRTLYLSPASTPGWLRSACGAVSSTGRAKDF